MPGIGLEMGDWSAVRVVEEMDTEGSCKGKKKIELTLIKMALFGAKK